MIIYFGESTPSETNVTHFRHSDGKLFQYCIEFEEGIAYIQDTLGNVTPIDLSDLDSLVKAINIAKPFYDKVIASYDALDILESETSVCV